jgi:SAM-dependent methyltransferase
VVGGDISESMLKRGREAASDKGSVRFVHLDMRAFDLGRRFDTVVVAANSLMHLSTHEEFASTFSSIARHLAPGGRLLFDLYVPSLHLLSVPPNERQPIGVFSHPRLGEVTVEETITYDPATQISRADWYWSREGAADFRRTQLHLRQIFPQELPLLLQLGGLELAERYGDFDRRPFDGTSWRQVCVAAKVD